MEDRNVMVELNGISKFFLHSRALNNVQLSVYRGESLGIVGHNGAGKSTLVNIISGLFEPTSGTLEIDGAAVARDYSPQKANQLGLRTVFQELSLCPNLTVVENMRVFHPSLSGLGWAKKAERLLMETLDTVFPGHGVGPRDVVENLSLGQRQIVEIGKAFCSFGEPLRLVILDEPTSALDHQTSRQLIDYINSLRGSDMSVIFISHMLDEVLACTSRIAVFKDGANVGLLETKSASKRTIIESMGEARLIREGDQAARTQALRADTPTVVEPTAHDGKIHLKVLQGEIVGLTGLAGHGQTVLLHRLFDYRNTKGYRIQGPTTFVAGDRQKDGIFPVWSIAKNLTVQVYDQLRRFLLLDLKRERTLAERWRQSISIKADSVANGILSLSGGNQQKVLFARCLESSAPLVLMDDPTRGVDVGTKDEIYKLILEESAKGRSFVWYTTEMSELKYCDRIYVFRAGEILAELSGDKVTEEDILKSSF